MDIKISAVICTYNRAAYLSKAIESLINQTLAKEQYEIIVVDNASTDNTKEVVEESLQATGFKLQAASSKPQAAGSKLHAPCPMPQTSCPMPNALTLRYIYEPVLGLSHARNTGWRKARGEYIAYLDDDAMASPQWLEKILEVFESVRPQPGCVSGKVEPVWESPRPDWLSDELLGQLSVLDWGNTPIFLESAQWIAGTNMAFSKKVLRETAGFQPKLGRKGDNLVSMEENLLRIQIEKKGYRCFYHPQIAVRHHIFAQKLTKKWFLRRAYYNGVSRGILIQYLYPHSLLARLIKGIRTLFRILLSPQEFICLVFTTNSSEHFIRKCSVVARVGHVMALWRIVR